MDTNASTPAHSFLVRVSSTDGDVFEDRDFAESARIEWFDQTVLFAEAGETIELMDESTGRVIESITKN